MPSPLIMRSFLVLAAFVGISAASAPAQAGIIVTVGKPCPEVNFDKNRPPAADGQRQWMYAESPDTRCVIMPDGQTRCGRSIRIDNVGMLPPDWTCVPVAKSVLYCETPSFGASPGAAGQGDFDPQGEEDQGLDQDEIQTLGCSGGAGVGGIATGVGGLIVLVAVRRRRALR